MVMLDILMRRPANDMIVAHFDHGTRPSSVDDAMFVQRVAAECQLVFATKREELGESVSEETARERRYVFLRKTSGENENAIIYTAHHLDDLVESIAINLLRGTGWRGLAVLDTPGIRRPFLEPEHMPKELRSLVPFDKKLIQDYAANCNTIYRQDPTNNEDNYLRNRVRKKLVEFPEKKKLYELWRRQKKLKAEIDEIVQDLLPKEGEAWQRSWFMDLDEKVALELLRAGTLRIGVSATRPQLLRFLQAIRTYAPGKCFNLPGDKLVRMNKDTFYL